MNHFKSPHWQSIHGKAIVIIGFTVGLLWAASVWGWNEYLRPRKENYNFLWNKVAEHEQRLLKLEAQ